MVRNGEEVLEFSGISVTDIEETGSGNLVAAGGNTLYFETAGRLDIL